MLSLLLAEKDEEFVPRSASVEAFLVGLVVVLAGFESTGSKVLPCRESSRERSTGRRREDSDASEQ